MHESYWDIVYETNNAVEANLVKSLLETNGINVVLKADESLLYAGATSLSSNYQLWIPESMLSDALRLIDND